MRWFLSDLHWRHDKLLTFDSPGTGRAIFENVQEMETKITENCDFYFDDTSIVYFVGDLSMGKEKAQYSVNWVRTRPWGEFHWILGNHDPKPEILLAEWEANGDDRPFFVNYQETIQIGDKFCIVQHMPPPKLDVDRHEDYLTKGNYKVFPRDYNPGGVVLHGHTHLNQKVQVGEDGTLAIHVGVDAWNYNPVSELEIVELIDEYSQSSETTE